MNERDALEDIRTEVNCATFAPEEYDLFGTLRLIGQKATEALDAPSEMQRLAEWLEARAKSYIGREYPPNDHTPVSVSPVRRQELQIVIDNIRKEFLGEKK